MLSWIIQITIISIILIFLVHYLIEFFKSTLTVPKIKDLVNTPTQKYDSMFSVITNSTKKNISYNEADLLPSATLNLNVNPNVNSSTTPNPSNDMKNELKSFLKKQMTVSSSSTDIASLGSYYSK
jgi:hypothetical protein